MPYTGAATVDDCITCFGEQYCDEPGLIIYGTITCEGGVYCDSDGESLPCEEGFFCPDGDTLKYRCDHGTYSDASASFCTTCDEGHYCTQPEPLDGTLAVTYTGYVAGVKKSDIDADTFACPLGFYCDVGTAIPDQYPCPIGTYGASTKLTSPTECTVCDATYYCPLWGMDALDTSFLCKDGYLCETGS